ncbi:MAG: GNAT family N-acetyltransferase [Gammaproteobacteria bacterium]
METRIRTSICSILATAWNALAGTEIPFLRHEYFAALEASGSLGPASGWSPCYLTAEDAQGAVLGAVPLFEKTDSRGEFIFDWGWAAALTRTGRDYYPKLVAAIPYTPVPGPRLLIARTGGPEVATQLVQAARALAARRDASSLHWLFVPQSELAVLQASGCLVRTGCHFLWSNVGLAGFDAWLATLTASRRKKIRRERRRILESGIGCQWREGLDLSEEELNTVYKLYAVTYYEHGMLPYLKPLFFHELARRLPPNLAVCFAYRGAEILACAVFLKDATTLYGRYWGAFEWVHSLHFELCYYQGIEYALAHGLDTFHPGVQGEHKLLRGFEPTLHYSAHWLRDADLHQAVAAFLERERAAIDDYAAEAAEFLPYHRDKG